MSKRERSGDERVKIKSEKIYIYFFFFLQLFFQMSYSNLAVLSISIPYRLMGRDGSN